MNGPDLNDPGAILTKKYCIMKTRTFQEIYDFCRFNNNYREYFNAPDQIYCKDRRTYRYYYSSVNKHGQSRLGTYIYIQSMNALNEFIGKRMDYRIHLERQSLREVSQEEYQKNIVNTIYICTDIGPDGVSIRFNNPFNGDYITLNPRSHRTFNKKGVIEEVRAYVEKYLYYAPGKYRDLQIEYNLPKQDFPKWYRKVKEQEAMEEEIEDDDRMTFEEAFKTLQMSGVFADFNCDDAEKDDMAEQFMYMVNFC